MFGALQNFDFIAVSDLIFSQCLTFLFYHFLNLYMYIKLGAQYFKINKLKLKYYFSERLLNASVMRRGEVSIQIMPIGTET